MITGLIIGGIVGFLMAKKGFSPIASVKKLMNTKK